MVDLAHVGGLIRTAREAMGLTIYDIAPKVGVTPQYIAQLERGKGNPTLDVLQKLSTAVNLDLNIRLSTEPTSPALGRLLSAAQRLSPDDLRYLLWMAWGMGAAPGPFKEGTATTFRKLAEAAMVPESLVDQVADAG